MVTFAKFALLAALTGATVLADGISRSVAAASPFGTLAGTWSGRGKATFDNGETEALKCNAYYRSLAGGNQLGLAIRCASASAKIELRANLAYAGGSVSGTWEERTYNATGTVSGSASANAIRLVFTGPIGGSMTMSHSRTSQQVSITSSGSSLRNVSMSLSK